MHKNVSFLDVPKCSATLEVSISRCHSVVCVAVPKLYPRLLPSSCPAPAQLPPAHPLISPPISDLAAPGHLPPDQLDVI